MLEREAQIRLTVFFAVLIIIALWEIFLPRRKRVASKATRWLNNLGLVALNGAMLRFVFPVLAVGIAILAEQRGWGLFYQFRIPSVAVMFVSVVLLDFLIYVQHLIFHKVSLFWRLHRMHHIDPDLDVTSGARFHPIEIALSMLIKMGFVILLGIPPEAVLIFEILLNASAMFNHGNINLPLSIDSILRWFVVTPDMHRIHHSIFREETDSNFGFFLSWWDRIFGTYTENPKSGQLDMVIGIGQFTEEKYLTLPWLMVVPFLNKK